MAHKSKVMSRILPVFIDSYEVDDESCISDSVKDWSEKASNETPKLYINRACAQTHVPRYWIHTCLSYVACPQRCLVS